MTYSVDKADELGADLDAYGEDAGHLYYQLLVLGATLGLQSAYTAVEITAYYRYLAAIHGGGDLVDGVITELVDSFGHTDELLHLFVADNKTSCTPPTTWVPMREKRYWNVGMVSTMGSIADL